MTIKTFNQGEPYWDNNCKVCKANGNPDGGIHYYLGYQEGGENHPGIYLGNCGRCNTTRVVPLSIQKIVEAKNNLEAKTE